MADIVVVGNRDSRPVAEHVAKLQAKLDPAHRVLGVPVGLITGKKQ